VLANQVTASADTLRTLVASTAATMATQSQTTNAQLSDRLALLEKAQYENQGRQRVSDPAMDNLALEVRKLTESRALGTGKSEGVSNSWGYIVGGIGLLIAIVMAVIAVAGFLKK
jgi:hypothetical protein